MFERIAARRAVSKFEAAPGLDNAATLGALLALFAALAIYIASASIGLAHL